MIKIPETKLIEPSKLVPDKTNPNLMSEGNYEALKKTIQKYGFLVPIITNKDLIIADGFNRMEAAIELGIEKVPVIVLDIEEVDRRMLRQIMNKLKGQHEPKMDKEEFQYLLDNDSLNDLAELLPEDEDILKMLEPEFEAKDDEFDTEEALKKPKYEVKLGEIYKLGNNRVMCGDSTKKKDVERLMDGEKADMVFTDPPYNVAQDSQNYASNISKAHKDLENSDWDKGFKPKDFVLLLPNVVKNDAFIYIFTSHRLFGGIVDLLEELFGGSSFLVWCKPNPMPSLAKSTWTFATELVVMSRRGKPVFNYPNGEHCLNWLSINKNSDGSHPTQKPIELCSKVVSLSSKKNDLVLDLFLGSGSTLIACEKTNRKCYGMEIDPTYCSVILERWEKFTGLKAIKEEIK